MNYSVCNLNLNCIILKKNGATRSLKRKETSFIKFSEELK